MVNYMKKINGKENILIFQGKFLDGKKWNGKGKEYCDDYLEFEGEYLNGKRWNGFYREYDGDRILIDYGTYSNGIPKSNKVDEEEESHERSQEEESEEK